MRMKIVGALSVFLSLPLLAPGGCLTAQDPGEPASIFAGLELRREFISSDLPQWTDWSGVRGFLMKDLSAGSLGGEIFLEERFGETDAGAVLEGYRELWEGAYGHLRLRVTPDAQVLPRADLRGEIFHAHSSGWELSGNVWYMDFPEEDVRILGAGIGKYVGNWYLRELTTISTLAGKSVISLSGTARRFLNPPREYLEVAGGVGKEVVVLGAGPTIDTRDTQFLQARVQRFLSERFGVSATLSYHTFEGAPTRTGFSAGILTRF